MSRKQREKSIDLLRLRPGLMKWVNQCGACQTRGVKPEVTDEGVDVATLRKQLGIMVLNDFGLCEMCGRR
jgi:hypothetical protein